MSGEFTKGISIILYLFCSCFFLWFLGLGNQSDYNFESFLMFTIVVIAGSTIFLGLQKLIRIDVKEENYSKWLNLFGCVCFTTILIVVFFFSIEILKVGFPKYAFWGGLIIVLSIFATMAYYIYNFKEKYDELDG